MIPQTSGLEIRGCWEPTPGLPWTLMRLPQISAGSPNVYCLIYTTPVWSYEDVIRLPEKYLNFEPPAQTYICVCGIGVLNASSWYMQED